ncbi:YhjD/YihY/BrkB family envelope integrity protein [Actinoplanes sp. NPDC049118]|uniref:YihY/virulence factor BrkB family protein n=1 Tax=Actinoplanes sp. NPDC049118 TaxID=3155769 RepID=UPI0033E03F1D
MSGEPGSRPGAFGSGLVRRLDALQRRHRFLGLPVAVMRKYFDDDGPRMAALTTYYGFLSLFPVLLLATAAVTATLKSHPALQQELLDRLVRPELQSEVEQALAQLPPSGVPLAVGLIGLLFAGNGGVLAAYFALNRIWAVPWRDRFGLVRQYVRAFSVMLLTFLCALLAAASALITDTFLRLPTAERGASAVATAAAVFATLTVAHKVLVCRPLRLGDIWVGGVIGALVVTALLRTATTVLPAMIARAGPVYGSFATVVGAFTLLYLISQTLVLSVEVSAVIGDRLSPRSLTGSVPNAADRRALALLGRQQERVPGQVVTTTFAVAAEGAAEREKAHR